MDKGGGGKRGRRRSEDQARAAYLKHHRIERTTARCAVCYELLHADMLREGTSRHRCAAFRK